MPIVASFGDEDTRSLISGEKSLYITGVIEGTENQSETPYCAIKSAHLAGISYCQSHN
jgi:hypothetical protein